MLSATAKNNFEKNMRKHAEQSATPNAPKRGKREKKKDWCLRAARGNGLMKLIQTELVDVSQVLDSIGCSNSSGWFTQKGHMPRKGHMVGEKLIKTRGMPLAAV